MGRDPPAFSNPIAHDPWSFASSFAGIFFATRACKLRTVTSVGIFQGFSGVRICFGSLGKKSRWVSYKVLSCRNLMCLAVSWLNTTVWRLNTKVSSFKGTHFFDGFSGHFHGIFSYGKGVGVWSDTNFITRTGRKVLPCNFFCLNLTPTMMETSRSMAHLRDMQFSIGFHDYLRLKGTEIWGPFGLLFW